MAEFRWILLGLGLLLFIGIWWWGVRRSAQAPGDAELRETTVIDPLRPETAPHDFGPALEMHEWDKSPFEPISIKTADFEHIAMFDEPMMADVAATPDEPQLSDDATTVPNAGTGPVMPPLLTQAVSPPAAPPPTGPVPNTDNSERNAAAAPPKPNTSEKQKIVSVRVSAPSDVRWSGSALLAAFEAQGLAFGRYQVFHRRHVDGASLFSVASLTEPGSFDVALMPTQQFKGLTLFAVLPGPVDPLLTVDAMVTAACGLAATLPGIVQDAKGVMLSEEKMAAMRDDVAQFQAALAVT